MKLEEFALERTLSLYENLVEYDISPSGVHHYTIDELLTEDEQQELLKQELGYGWTNGSVELRETIAALYKDRDADNVVVSSGSAEANLLVVLSFLEPGDEIIVVVPNFLQIWGLARGLGITVKELWLKEDLGWQPDFSELSELVTPKTKMISICHPNNPTGQYLSLEDMQRLARFCRDHEIWLHADEIYRGSEITVEEPPSFADLYEKAIVSSGTSKAMGLPGLRVGWLVGPKDEIYVAWQRKDYASTVPSTPMQFIADIALKPARRQQILERGRARLRSNLSIVSNWVESYSDHISFLPPQAGAMAFFRYHYDINSTELMHRLRKEQNILVLAGDVYGLDHFIRIGICIPEEHLRIGLERMDRLFESLNSTYK